MWYSILVQVELNSFWWTWIFYPGYNEAVELFVFKFLFYLQFVGPEKISQIWTCYPGQSLSRHNRRSQSIDSKVCYLSQLMIIVQLCHWSGLIMFRCLLLVSKALSFSVLWLTVCGEAMYEKVLCFCFWRSVQKDCLIL